MTEFSLVLMAGDLSTGAGKSKLFRIVSQCLCMGRRDYGLGCSLATSAATVKGTWQAGREGCACWL